MKVAALDGVPDVPDDLALFWEAWLELHAGRHQSYVVTIGYGKVHPSPVQFREIAAWAELNLVDRDLRPELCAVIKGLDARYLKEQGDRA